MRIKDHGYVIREGDEHVCRICKKRWDHSEPDDDIPPCVEDNTKKKRIRKPKS